MARRGPVHAGVTYQVGNYGGSITDRVHDDPQGDIGPNDQGFGVDGTVAKVRGMVSASPGPCPFPGSIPVLAARVPDHFSDNKT